MKNSTSAATAITTSTIFSVSLFGTGAKLIAEDQRADEHEREDAAEVVDRLGPSFTWAGTSPAMHERDHGERQREQEHRAQ